MQVRNGLSGFNRAWIGMRDVAIIMQSVVAVANGFRAPGLLKGFCPSQPLAVVFHIAFRRSCRPQTEPARNMSRRPLHHCIIVHRKQIVAGELTLELHALSIARECGREDYSA